MPGYDKTVDKIIVYYVSKLLDIIYVKYKYVSKYGAVCYLHFTNI